MRYYPKGSANNRKNTTPVTQPGIDKTVTLEENAFSEWLYGEYDENKFKQVSILRHSILGPYIDYLLDYRQDMEYMRRYGLDWSDIHDPRKLHSSDSYGRLGASTLEFVSDNIKYLY